jgi:cholesterol oxidase
MSRISRRTFLRTSVPGLVMAAGAMNSQVKRTTDFTPALVVGTGFGGAVAALRLGLAGIDTIVLERGRRWPITPSGDTFATFEHPDGRAAFLSPFTAVSLIEQQLGLTPPQVDIFAGVLEGVPGQGINVALGAGVGGGSLVYNAISVQPRRELFERVFPPAIAYDEMDAVYYPRVRSVLQPEPIPHDVLETPFYQSTRVNLVQAQRAGFETRLIELAVDWNIVREEIAGTKVPSAIAGQSWYGLNSGAKKSLDRNYLAMAEQTGRVQILPLHVADTITESRNGMYVVEASEIDLHGTVVARRQFACRHLFLAAGSLGTTRLLLKSKTLGLLPRLSDQVGRVWGNNGDFIAVRSAGSSTNPGTGGPAGHFIADYLQDPSAPTSLTELVTPRHLALLPTLSSYVGMGMLPAVGELVYDPSTDRIVPRLAPAADPRLTGFLAAARGMLDRFNATNTDADLQPSTLLFDPTLTAHPLGGAAVGAVCDDCGRVKRHGRLYVVDGAFVPGSSGLVNPSLTIAALAERSMDRILSDDLLR